jgi:hypothetical protein
MPTKSKIKYNPNQLNSNAKLQQALATLGLGQIRAWPVGASKFSEERLRKGSNSIHLDFPIVGPWENAGST